MDETTYLPNLPQLRWVQTIRDPIWGEIPITEVEKQIIQTEAFYRLRGIKQLSFAYLAFPGAVHSRFEHSLGVMHATDMLLKMVRGPDNDSGIPIHSFARQVLRLAALLHDIGHPPFSHAMESLFSQYPDILGDGKESLPEALAAFLADRNLSINDLGRHEVFTEYIICHDPDIRQALRHWIESDQGEYIPAASLAHYTGQIIRKVIARLAVGETVDKRFVPRNILPLIRIFKSIMSGDIDADKIDYLMRDNYYCGLPHGLDLTSLRHQLTLRQDGVELRPGAIGFVHSLILARYRLITEVHHESWGAFATAKAIELLHESLRRELHPVRLILEIFTKWDDSKLLDYLFHTSDVIIKSVLTTQYPLREVARLEFLETHPYVRACVRVLSESMHHDHLPALQNDLRQATGNPELFVHIRRVKSPEFSMELATGGNLLRDEILRGISEESIKNLHLIVYGNEELHLDLQMLRASYSAFLPCEKYSIADECVGNLRDEPAKLLLAELAVRRYHDLCRECGEEHILAMDFLLLLMEKVSTVCHQKQIPDPIRQDLYMIARQVYKALKGKPKLMGAVDLGPAEITSTFYQELRSYEQMGLIAYVREIRKLRSEENPEREVFRFDRRFRLGEFGKQRLNLMRQLEEHVQPCGAYLKGWHKMEDTMARLQPDLVRILRQGAQTS